MTGDREYCLRMSRAYQAVADSTIPTLSGNGPKEYHEAQAEIWERKANDAK